MTEKFKKGQIVLFVIIILMIALIIVTSVASRSLTGTKTTNINTDSSRAFNAAESGIEELLNRTDIASLAGQGPVESQHVNPSNFSEHEYEVVELGYETPEEVARDSLLQFDFNGDPGNLIVSFTNENACILVSAISSTGAISRSLTCGKPQSAFSGATVTATLSVDISYTLPLKTILIKILNSTTKITVTAQNPGVLLTKFIKASSWATTKSGVKKEIEVTTKTTKDIFPVFDYALYIK